MKARPICACGQPIRDNTMLCTRCTRRLEQDLAEIPALADEVETTRLRQSRTGGQAIGGGHSSDRPLPFDDRPAVAVKQLLEVLHPWVQLVVEQRGAPSPPDTAADLARCLLGQLDWLRHRDEAAQLHDDLVHAVGRVRGSVDRRAEKVYAGPCGAIDYWPDGHPILCSARCPGDVYGRPGSKTATCQQCGAKHDVKERRDWMLDEAQDMLVTAVELSRFLTLYGDHVTTDRIHKWAERGRLEVRGTRPALGERRPAQLFRVGDARLLIEELGQQQARRAG